MVVEITIITRIYISKVVAIKLRIVLRLTQFGVEDLDKGAHLVHLGALSVVPDFLALQLLARSLQISVDCNLCAVYLRR